MAGTLVFSSCEKANSVWICIAIWYLTVALVPSQATTTSSPTTNGPTTNYAITTQSPQNTTSNMTFCTTNATSTVEATITQNVTSTAETTATQDVTTTAEATTTQDVATMAETTTTQDVIATAEATTRPEVTTMTEPMTTPEVTTIAEPTTQANLVITSLADVVSTVNILLDISQLNGTNIPVEKALDIAQTLQDEVEMITGGDFNEMENGVNALKMLIDSTNTSVENNQSKQFAQAMANGSMAMLNLAFRALQTDPSDKQAKSLVEDTVDVITDVADLMLKQVKKNEVWQVETSDVAITVAKPTRETVGKTVVTSGHAQVTFPESLSDHVVGSGFYLQVIMIKENPYLSTVSIKETKPVVEIKMISDDGTSIPNVDPDDPLTLAMGLEHILSSDKLTPITADEESGLFYHSFGLNDSDANAFLVDVRLPKATETSITYRLLASYDYAPSESSHDFRATVGATFDIELNTIGIMLVNWMDSGSSSLAFFLPRNSFRTKKLFGITLENLTNRQQISPSGRRRLLAVDGLDQSSMRAGEHTVMPIRLDPGRTQWLSDPGLQISSITSDGRIEFKSNFFGSLSLESVFLPPNAIDFEVLFTDFGDKLAETPHVLIVICVLFALYILLLLFARRADKEDAFKWAYLPLIDNQKEHNYLYAISVETAISSSKKITPSVFFVLHGDEETTAIRILKDCSSRQNFTRGSTCNFLMSTEHPIGTPLYLQIWHNNEGDSKAWKLSKFNVTDLQTRVRALFICQKWLAVNKDDGSISRTLPVAYEEMLKNPQSILQQRWRNLYDDHLWLSVFRRPNYSRFSRVQRLSSAMALLFLTMITSAMWLKTSVDTNIQESALSVGPIELRMSQISAGIVSSLIVIPVSMCIVMIFKRRRYRGEAKPEPSDKRSRNRTLLTRMEEKFERFYFPWWFIFVGYFLVFVSVSASATFSLFYSLYWGTDTSVDWLMSIFYSFSGSLFLVQPLKFAIVIALLACVCRRFPENAGIEVDELIRCRLQHWSDDENLVKPEITPCPKSDTDDIRELRRVLLVDHKLSQSMKSIIFLVLYVALLVLLCNPTPQDVIWRQNNLIRNVFQASYFTTDTAAKKPRNIEEVWSWLNKSVIPNAYPKKWENGNPMFLYDQKFLSDHYSYRLTPLRLRQLRNRNGTCFLTKGVHSLVGQCIAEYSPENEDKLDYSFGWNTSGETVERFSYTEAETTDYLVHRGQFGSYEPGGYIVDLGTVQPVAYANLQTLMTSNWVDRRTRVLFVEIVVYNANSRMFSSVNVRLERPPLGAFLCNFDVQSLRLYPYNDAWDIWYLFVQIAFLVITVIRIGILVVATAKKRCDLVLTLQFWVTLLELLLSTTAILAFIIGVFGKVAAIETVRGKGTFTVFDTVVLLDYIYYRSLAFVLFMRIICLLSPIRFNKQLNVMIRAIEAGYVSIWAYGIIFFLLVMAFGALMTSMMGQTSTFFKSTTDSMFTLLRMILKMAKFKQIHLVEQIAVQFIFAIYTILSAIVLLNFFVAIINESLTSMRKNPERQNFDQELNQHFWNKFTRIWNYVFSVTTVDSKVKGYRQLKENPSTSQNICRQLNKSILVAASSKSIEKGPGKAQLKLNSRNVEIENKTDENGMQATVGEVLMCETMSDETYVTFRFFIQPNYPVIFMRIPAVPNKKLMLTCRPISPPILSSNFRDLYCAADTSAAPAYEITPTAFEDLETTCDLAMVRPLSSHHYPESALFVSLDGCTNWREINSEPDNPPELQCLPALQCSLNQIPSSLTVITRPVRETFAVPLSGTMITSSVEPRLRLVIDKGTFITACSIGIQGNKRADNVISQSDRVINGLVISFLLIPCDASPILCIQLNERALKPISATLPLSVQGENMNTEDLCLMTRENVSEWRDIPTVLKLKEDTVAFKLPPPQNGDQLSAMVKSSEIMWVERTENERQLGTVDWLSKEIDEDWTSLAVTLGCFTHTRVQTNKCYSERRSTKSRAMLANWWQARQSSPARRLRQLQKALRRIGRHDLALMLTQRQSELDQNISSRLKDAMVMKAFNMIARNVELASGWRHVGTLLGLTKTQLDDIDRTGIRSIQEKCFFVLMQWRSSHIGDCIAALIEQFSKMGLHLVAEKLKQFRQVAD